MEKNIENIASLNAENIFSPPQGSPKNSKHINNPQTKKTSQNWTTPDALKEQIILKTFVESIGDFLEHSRYALATKTRMIIYNSLDDFEQKLKSKYIFAYKDYVFKEDEQLVIKIFKGDTFIKSYRLPNELAMKQWMQVISKYSNKRSSEISRSSKKKKDYKELYENILSNLSSAKKSKKIKISDEIVNDYSNSNTNNNNINKKIINNISNNYNEINNITTTNNIKSANSDKSNIYNKDNNVSYEPEQANNMNQQRSSKSSDSFTKNIQKIAEQTSKQLRYDEPKKDSEKYISNKDIKDYISDISMNYKSSITKNSSLRQTPKKNQFKPSKISSPSVSENSMFNMSNKALYQNTENKNEKINKLFSNGKKAFNAYNANLNNEEEKISVIFNDDDFVLKKSIIDEPKKISKRNTSKKGTIISSLASNEMKYSPTSSASSNKDNTETSKNKRNLPIEPDYPIPSLYPSNTSTINNEKIKKENEIKDKEFDLFASSRTNKYYNENNSRNKCINTNLTNLTTNINSNSNLLSNTYINSMNNTYNNTYNNSRVNTNINLKSQSSVNSYVNKSSFRTDIANHKKKITKILTFRKDNTESPNKKIFNNNAIKTEVKSFNYNNKINEGKNSVKNLCKMDLFTFGKNACENKDEDIRKVHGFVVGRMEKNLSFIKECDPENEMTARSIKKNNINTILKAKKEVIDPIRKIPYTTRNYGNLQKQAFKRKTLDKKSEHKYRSHLFRSKSESQMPIIVNDNYFNYFNYKRRAVLSELPKNANKTFTEKTETAYTNLTSTYKTNTNQTRNRNFGSRQDINPINNSSQVIYVGLTNAIFVKKKPETSRNSWKQLKESNKKSRTVDNKEIRDKRTINNNYDENTNNNNNQIYKDDSNMETPHLKAKEQISSGKFFNKIEENNPDIFTFNQKKMANHMVSINEKLNQNLNINYYNKMLGSNNSENLADERISLNNAIKEIEDLVDKCYNIDKLILNINKINSEFIGGFEKCISNYSYQDGFMRDLLKELPGFISCKLKNQGVYFGSPFVKDRYFDAVRRLVINDIFRICQIVEELFKNSIILCNNSDMSNNKSVFKKKLMSFGSDLMKI